MPQALHPIGLAAPCDAVSSSVFEGIHGFFDAFATDGVEDTGGRMGAGHQGVRDLPGHEGHGDLRVVLRKGDFAHNAVTQFVATGGSKDEGQKEKELLHGIRILRAMQWMG